MTFINTDGMSFIGPGSEWFWTALTGLVLALTFLAIYRQLRLQRTQNVIEQLDAFKREAYSEAMTRYGLDVMKALRDHDDPADIPEAAVLGLGDFWANFATLARNGHRDAALLWQSNSASPQIVWCWIAPFIHNARVERRLGVPSYVDFEWLVGELAEMDRTVGRQAITTALVMANLDHLIGLHQDLIKYAEAQRSTRT